MKRLLSEDFTERTTNLRHINEVLVIVEVVFVLVGLNGIERDELVFDVVLGSVLHSMLKGKLFVEFFLKSFLKDTLKSRSNFVAVGISQSDCVSDV